MANHGRLLRLARVAHAQREGERIARDSVATLLRLRAAALVLSGKAPRNFAMVVRLDDGPLTLDTPTTTVALREELEAEDLDAALDTAAEVAEERGAACAVLVATFSRAGYEVDGRPGGSAELVITRTDDGVTRETFLLHTDPRDERFGTMTSVVLSGEGVAEQAGFAVPLPPDVEMFGPSQGSRT